MARLFDGNLHVGYHQATLVTPASDGQGLMPEDCFAGQTNGLCGAAVRGALMFTTGLHHGGVGFTVDVLDSAPPLDESWEEIVEVSFINEDESATLCDFYGTSPVNFPLKPGTYRVRYSARGVEKGAEVDTIADGAPVDFYSLILWLAPSASDAVIKQTTEFAKYWHSAYTDRS